MLNINLSLTIRRSVPARRHGFSLVEVAVIVGIVLVLLAISIPIVRDMRSLTRRRNCDQNLIKLAMGLRAYEAETSHLPSGTLTFNASVVLPNVGPAEWPTSSGDDVTVRSLAEGYHHSWITACLPKIDRQALFQSIDFSDGVYSPKNEMIRKTSIPFLRCADSGDQVAFTTSYAGMHHGDSSAISSTNHGLLTLNRLHTTEGIPDGAAQTILVGEKLSLPDWDLGWMSGTRSSLRNAGTPINAPLNEDDHRDPLFVGGFGSRHAGGASVAMADGSVQFLTETIDTVLFKQMASPNDQALEASPDQDDESSGAGS